MRIRCLDFVTSLRNFCNHHLRVSGADLRESGAIIETEN